MSPTTFTCFPTLPVELQSAIWDCALDTVGDRIVNIKMRVPEGETASSGTAVRGSRGIPVRVGHHFSSSTPVPNVLHICHASRSRALKRWALTFAALNTTPTIFFDYNRDTLLFYWRHSETKAWWETCAGKDQVQKIAFDLKVQWDNYFFSSAFGLSRILRRLFPKLGELVLLGKNLNLLLEQERTKEQNLIQFVRPHYRASDESHFFRLLEDFKDIYAKYECGCPTIKEVDWIYVDNAWPQDRERMEASFNQYRNVLLSNLTMVKPSRLLESPGIAHNELRGWPCIVSDSEEFYQI